MYEVYVATQFEAAHRLVGDFGPATRMHGHTYRLEVLVRGERLSEDGTLTESKVTAGPDRTLRFDVPLGPARTTDESLVLVEAGEFLSPHTRVEVFDIA